LISSPWSEGGLGPRRSGRFLTGRRFRSRSICDRLPPPERVEIAAYYVVAEMLTKDESTKAVIDALVDSKFRDLAD
jgi:hypothetical protein